MDRLLFGERLRYIRKTVLKLNTTDFSREIGISPGYVNFIENGRAVPNAEVLNLLYHKYLVNCNWLVTGEGDAFLNETHLPDTPQPHTVNEPTERYDAAEILSRQSNVSAVYDAEALRKQFEEDLVEKLTEREQLIEQNRELQELIVYMHGQIDALQTLFATLRVDVTQKPREAAP